MDVDEASQGTGNRGYIIAGAVVALVAAMLLMPIDYPGRLLGVVFDYGHVPLFATLVLVVLRLVAGREPSLKLAVGIAVAAVLFGVGGEVLQKHVGRSTELGDAISNAVGAAVGFFIATWRRWSARQRKLGVALLVAALAVAFVPPTRTLFDVYRQRSDFPMLGSFESELELSRWHCRKASKQRSQKYASDGEWCLQWDLKPAEYPEVHIRWPFGDWAKYEKLEVDVWNDDEPITLVLKVEDTKHNGQYEDRFQQEFVVSPGKSTLSVGLDEVRSAPAEREMDMQLIARVSLFTMDLKEKRVLYLDRLQLVGERDAGGE